MGPSPGPASRPGRGRGQVYTLEGVIGALLVLTALLFAMQSLVLTPATGGAVDASVRSGVAMQAEDVLALSMGDGELSRTVRYWNNSTTEETFAGGDRRSVGYGTAVPPTGLGRLLEARFLDRGFRVNLDVVYHTTTDGTGQETRRLMYHGVPAEAAVVATAPVTIFDADPLTGPRTTNETVGTAAVNGSYPIPDVVPEGPLHNTVTVRVIVW